MEKELEIKLLNLDMKEPESSLIKKGASLIAHENQKNIIVSSSTGNFKSKGDYLRIRLIDDLLNKKYFKYLTFKKLKNNKEIRESEEYTIQFDDLDNLKNILASLGYDEFELNLKERYSYKYKDLRIDFDFWDRESFPFDYVEVEFKSYEQLELFLKEFNISKESASTKSIGELKKMYFKGI